jgi:glycerol transport system ATP-binding protein
MSGIERPDSGRIYYDGKDVTDVPVQKRSVAMVYQWFVNYPSMTAYENIATPLRASSKKMSESEIRNKIQNVATLLKIDSVLANYPSQLSGGQQQRLAIARALAKDANYIFLDEPLTNLDYKLQEELRVELKNIFAEKEHGAVVFATPQPLEALVLSTSVGFLHGGRLMQFGPVGEVYRKPRFIEVGRYFSHPGMNVFECKLVSEANRLWLKATDELKVEVNRFHKILKNEHYLVGIRPHALGTQRQNESMVPVNGTVELGEVVGSDTELHMSHQGIPLVAFLQGMETFEIGQEITLYLHADRFFIYDKASGELVARTQIGD